MFFLLLSECEKQSQLTLGFLIESDIAGSHVLQDLQCGYHARSVNVHLTGQKTIFQTTSCHFLYISRLFLLFSLSSLFSSVPFTISSPLSASADAYHTPSMCGCRVWAPACQKCCIVFILSEHGPGWLVIALHTDTHTHTQRNHMSSLSIRLCQWEAAGCHNEQSPHKETSEDKQRLLSRTWLECVYVCIVIVRSVSEGNSILM